MSAREPRTTAPQPDPHGLAAQLATLAGRATDLAREIAFVARQYPYADFPTLASADVLAVPYHSQHERDAQATRLDCGPTCVEMLGKYYRPDSSVSTDQIMRYLTGGVNRTTSTADLSRAMRHFFGYDLERHAGATWHDLERWLVDERAPVIVLVHYGADHLRMDRGYGGGHWMVALGMDRIDYQGRAVGRVICHDPDWYGGLEAQGAFLPFVRAHFDGMWQGNARDGNPDGLALVPVEVTR